MAIIANLSFPSEVISLESIVTEIGNRFPVPLTVHGSLISEPSLSFALSIVGLANPYAINNAVVQEGSYMEPTIGQIWPR